MIGEQIKKLRKLSGQKIVDFAKILGVDPSYISLVEGGHRTPTRPTLHKWAGRLGISAGAIDLILLEAPRELTKAEKRKLENIKGALMATLVFKFIDQGKVVEIKATGEEK